MTKIGERIQQLRKEAGYTTQTSFAKALGVPPSRLNEWEKSRYKSPSTKTLLKIAGILGKKVDELFPESSDLPYQSGGVDSAGTQQPRRGTPDADASDSSRRLEHALEELQEAVILFQELAAASAEWNKRASEWIRRITDIQIGPAESLARRQVAMGGDSLPSVPGRRRDHHRQADRARRRKRTA